MQLPCIHPNGTSKEDLLDGLGKTRVALCEAYQSMKRAAPNQRDYYPLGNDAFKQAVEEHMARLRRLGEIVDELDCLMRGIDCINRLYHMI